MNTIHAHQVPYINLIKRNLMEGMEIASKNIFWWKEICRTKVDTFGPALFKPPGEEALGGHIYSSQSPIYVSFSLSETHALIALNAITTPSSSSSPSSSPTTTLDTSNAGELIMADLLEELHYPQYFLPPGLQIEEHLFRASRADVTIQNPPTKRHEDFMAVLVEPQPPEGSIQDLIHQVVHIINHQYRFQVVRTIRFPLALCLVQLTSEVSRDALLAGDPMVLNNGDFNARIVCPDNLDNRRNYPFSREGWIMILGIPPDFRNESHIERVVNTFRKLVAGITVIGSWEGF